MLDASVSDRVAPVRPRGRAGWRWALGGAALLAVVVLGAAGAEIALSPLPLASWLHHPTESLLLSEGINPNPAALRRPAAAPLSAMALLGQKIFYDPSLSSSGQLSCSSCHSPDHAYGPADAAPVVLGGPDLKQPGQRAVPSLMYLERQTAFSVGPDNEENENVSLADLAAQGKTAPRAEKTAASTDASAANIVPQGGLFWDGRVDTLQAQALGPLFNPIEMNGGDAAHVAAKLMAAPYAEQMRQLFGDSVFDDPDMAVSEAMFAVARYEFENPDFHPYTSKFDAWLEGKARLSRAEARGYILYNDPDKADCGGCHLDKPTAEGMAPLFTDFQYEAIGVPRNPAIPANRDPAYYDLGICGPTRTDMEDQTQYCGMFLTPTLRNTATRKVFFHNGRYHTLDEVMDFYDFRDTDPGRVYPRDAKGNVDKYDDIPPQFRANADVTDPPFDRHLGEKPAMTEGEMQDIIAFLKTLTDGYTPRP
jgi:cytochrome c peroxidase